MYIRLRQVWWISTRSSGLKRIVYKKNKKIPSLVYIFSYLIKQARHLNTAIHSRYECTIYKNTYSGHCNINNSYKF